MRKQIFYIFLTLQVVALFAIVGQHYFIDQYGTAFKIYIDETYDYSFFNNNGDVYVDYDITEITKDKWGINTEGSYNDTVYVRLEVNKDGVFEVIDVADHKLHPYDNDQVVLKAKYIYEYSGKYHLDYGLQEKININYFKDVARNEQMVAIFKRASWGQIKLVDVTNH